MGFLTIHLFSQYQNNDKWTETAINPEIHTHRAQIKKKKKERKSQ